MYKKGTFAFSSFPSRYFIYTYSSFYTVPRHHTAHFTYTQCTTTRESVPFFVCYIQKHWALRKKRGKEKGEKRTRKSREFFFIIHCLPSFFRLSLHPCAWFCRLYLCLWVWIAWWWWWWLHAKKGFFRAVEKKLK